MNVKTLLKSVITITIIVTASSFLFFGGVLRNQIKSSKDVEYSLAKLESSSMRIKNYELEVEIAKEPSELSRGLGGKRRLKEHEGMLFIFRNKSIPSFWMKDMNFPIDIIWISDNKIVDIDEKVPNHSKNVLDSDLPRYSPSTPINYVLEVNAGYCDKFSISVGDEVEIPEGL